MWQYSGPETGQDEVDSILGPEDAGTDPLGLALGALGLAAMAVLFPVLSP